METIGIIAAMQDESQAVLRLVEKRNRSDLGPYRCYRFQLLDRDCWLVTSGMGIQRAEQATRTLIEAAGPSLLVSVGIAGAVEADLMIGDVVNSTNTGHLNKGELAFPFHPLARLAQLAWQAAQFVLKAGGAGLYAGTAITTHGGQFVQPKSAPLIHPVLEMETAGILGAVAQKGIPILSLRAISDGPRAPIPFDLEKMFDENDTLRTGEIIKTMLSHPKILAQLVRNGRNSRLAADNAAMALIAALKQPGPVIAL